MINFDSNIDDLIPSVLDIKASGSIINDVKNDLQLPDGEDIGILLANEEKNKNTK